MSFHKSDPLRQLPHFHRKWRRHRVQIGGLLILPELLNPHLISQISTIFLHLPPSSSRSSSWQANETILEFLRRLPVADPETASVGPWLWVHCSPELQDSSDEKDLDTFIETASPLLDGLRKQRVIIEQHNPGKAVVLSPENWAPTVISSRLTC